MVLGTSDLPSPPASSFQPGGGRGAPRRSSSTGDESLGDPCSCSECGSSDEDPPPALGLELALINGVGGKAASNKTVVVDNNASVLDMHALEAPESRKMKDDSKAHHILEDAMFKPRKRFHRHHRHMLPTDSNNDLYHHNIRKNLRHILSHSVHNHHHNQSHRRGSHRHGSHHKGLHEEEEKPRKNVSFANLSEAEVTAMGKKPEDKNKTNSVKKDEDAASHHSVDSEGGITFTVSKVKEGDKTDFTLSKSADRPNAFSPSKKQQKHAPAPTLTETTLPWHNSASNEPVSMQSIVTIYNENEPCPSPGEAVWFDTVPLKEQESIGSPHTPLENMKFMKESPAVVMETYNTKEEEVPRYSSTSSAPQQPSGEPDIVNCSMPTGSHENILPWNHKIDDVHEHGISGGSSALPDLGVSAPSMSPVDVVDGPLSVTTSDDCYLPATWRTSDELAPAISPSQRSAGYGDAPDGDSQQTDLPLPWRNNDQGDHSPGSESDTDSAPKSNVVFELGPPSESASARSLPWETATPGEVVLDMEEDGEDGMVTSDVDQSSMRCLSTDSAPDPDDCLPPPWRSVNVSEASIPVRSPSASHELDSLVPQASHNSLRLSEAESRHSEQFRGHHHVIDIAPRELEHSSSGSALSAMVGDDSEPLDLVSRVQRWLLDTKLDQQDPVPEDLYDTALQDSCAAAVLAVADLSDTGECEDTYL